MMTKTKTVDRRPTESLVVEHDQRAAISLADLPFTTPEELGDHGFPYNVPTELTEDEGREVERIMARGAPEWVRKLRERSGR